MCEYFPVGNVIGEFGTEVQSQTKGASCPQGGVCSGTVAGMDSRRGTIWLAVTVSVMLAYVLML